MSTSNISFTWSNDLTTGFGRPAVGQIAFVGKEKSVVNIDGDVLVSQNLQCSSLSI